MIKYIIFDFDGTLVDSKQLSITVINQLAEKYNIPKLNELQIEELRKIPIKQRLKKLSFPLIKLPFAIVDFLHLYKQSSKDLEFFSGSKEMLNQLQEKGYRLAIISSNSEDIIKEVLQENNITTINAIHCSNNLFGKNKVISNFLKKHHLKPSEILYVGDEIRDIVACREVGVKIIWVSWGFDAIDVTKIAPPDYIAHTPHDIVIHATFANKT